MKPIARIQRLKTDERGKQVVRVFLPSAEQEGGTRMVSFYGDGPQIVARVRADLPDWEIVETFGG